MPRVSVSTLECSVAGLSDMFASDGEVRSYFEGEAHTIQVHIHCLAHGEVLRIAPRASDCAAYVWRGCVMASDVELTSGSSFIVERAAKLEIIGSEETSQLTTFAASPRATKPRTGGRVHLLPNERVPRFGNVAAGGSLAGGLHADATCPSCAVWLHENDFAAPYPDAPAGDPDAGVHCHTEDEVIFITAGQMRVGSNLYGPGTALAIAASTLYGFSTGPAGLSFINFRPGKPREIRFKNGNTMDEVSFWRERVPAPDPISLESSFGDSFADPAAR